jgi:hypothetical protein
LEVFFVLHDKMNTRTQGPVSNLLLFTTPVFSLKP